MLRHWQRAFRLAIGHGHEAQVEGRFLLLFRCAGFCLEQAAGDPLGHKGDLSVGELVFFVRHERLLLMGDKLIKDAAIRVAGLDRAAAAAALEHVRVARQVEAALGLVGVVAGIACALKKRANIILISDFLLRLGKWRIAEPSGDREQDGVFEMHGQWVKMNSFELSSAQKTSSIAACLSDSFSSWPRMAVCSSTEGGRHRVRR